MASQKFKILMLGWEFPPQITGGLGTACEGLTQALSRHDVRIHFFMPKLYGNEAAPYLNLYDVGDPEKAQLIHSKFGPESGVQNELFFHEIPSFLSPYLRPENKIHREIGENSSSGSSTILSKACAQHYGYQLFEEVENYGRQAAHISKEIDFELIHAHDWMTFPAALRIKQKTGKPVILHVHSLESDRAGSGGNPVIHQIESAALHAADAIIAVSHYTKRKMIENYRVKEEKIHVVHNGISKKRRTSLKRRFEGNPTVLFLGRITFQKGPDYFVEAALRVLEQLPEARFILAGTGDMLDQLRSRIQMAGVESSFWLPGFLRGKEVDEVFALADLYVMPSVSEPFGISVLEALNCDVPVLVSRQSGVSEVIQHSLKADFWDIDELVDLMVGTLKYPELGRDLLQMAQKEMVRLDWGQSAARVTQVYRQFS